MRALLRGGMYLSAALLVVSTTACSGGSGNDPPASGCTRAAVPPTGPGDPLNYFPSEVGWSWNYRLESTGQTGTMTVSGTQVVGTETAAMFTSSTGGAPTVELVVERPSGAYVLADPSEQPPFDQLYPSLIIPFPVAVTPSAQQVSCSSLAVGDLDGDGKGDVADLVGSLQVFSITETAQVPAGSFTDVAHVQQVATVTVHATAAGTVQVTATQDDWFAPGVGRVVSLTTMSTTGYSQSETVSLVSYAPPTTALASAGARMARSVSAADRAPRLEERALQLARATIAAR